MFIEIFRLINSSRMREGVDFPILSIVFFLGPLTSLQLTFYSFHRNLNTFCMQLILQHTLMCMYVRLLFQRLFVINVFQDILHLLRFIE